MSGLESLFIAGDASLPAGDARCPGPSPQDIIATDNDGAPTTLRTEKSLYLGSEDLAFARYTSTEQFDKEVEQLWTRTWQWACREEQIPKPGDFTTYDIDRYSIVVIRGDDQKIRAFVNSCPHRGMQFVDAGSSGSGKQFLRCPFHGMSWQLDGSLREIPCRWDFPHIKDAEFQLPQVQCDLWGGFVFINMDLDAAPLQEYLGVLPEHFAAAPLEDRFIRLHTQKVLHGNWKMVMEGFLEAFHVLATHPGGLHLSGWANTQYDVFDKHVSRFLQTLSSGNPHHPNPLSQTEIVAALGHDVDEFPEDGRARDFHAQKLRESLGEQWSTDLSAVSNSLMLDSIEYHVFPNACFFPGINIPLIYRFRPLGPDKTLHDIMLLQPLPDSGERPAPARTVKLDIDTSYTTVENFGRLDVVLDQDSDNFKRQWAGMRASRKAGQTLANYQEVRIRHFHQVLDEYLAG